MTNKSPAFQWYPKDILASMRVQEMSLAEEGAYRRLLDFCWINGSIPADASRVARIIGKGCTIETAQICLKMFTISQDDESRMIHDRLEVEREKQEATSRARTEAAEARWKKQGKSAENGKSGKPADVRGKRDEADNTNGKQAQSKLDANAMQMQCTSSSSASSSADTKKELSSESSKKSKKTATRLPKNFALSPEMIQWAGEMKIPKEVSLETETEIFKNHYGAMPDSNPKAFSENWEFTWRNWILGAKRFFEKEVKNGKNINGGGTNRGGKRTDADIIRESADFYANWSDETA